MRKLLLLLVAEYVIIRLESKHKAGYDQLAKNIKIKNDQPLK